MLNLKDVIIKDLQAKNQRLCNKTNNPEKKYSHWKKTAIP